MDVFDTGRQVRTTIFAPRIDELMKKYRGEDAFRLDATTVGVAGPGLMDRLLQARPLNESERPTFKPLLGKSISRVDTSGLMRAISQDVRAALKKEPTSVDLSGVWPNIGHSYLEKLMFGNDPLRLRVLISRKLEINHAMAWTVLGAAAAVPWTPRPGQSLSALATYASVHASYTDRMHAMGLYRRMSAPVCFTVSTLVTNALWLGSPFGDGTSNRHILLETLRLLPPSWNLLRMASPEFHEVDPRIEPKDDVLLLPLLSHRDPDLWDAPDEYRPERWHDLDPDEHPGYLPFGHAAERCWGRHLVLPLAERLLDLLREQKLAVNRAQASAEVPLDGLLGVSRVQVSRS